MNNPARALAAAWGLCAVAAATSATPAQAAPPAPPPSYSCGGHGAPIPQPAGALLSCTYAHAPGLHRTDEGGPWVHIDLLHDSLLTLRELFLGTSAGTMYAGGPRLPPLGLVHSYICLSDPTVPPGQCPEDYPDNPANAGLGYRLNPHIVPLLQQGLNRLRRAGLKTIVRFTYNYPHGQSSQNCANDAPIGTILEQMRELAPVINRNRDVVYALQAGFIGFWGEWHNSSNGNDDVRIHNRFLDQFRALFAGQTLLEVRDPYQIRDYSLHLFHQDQGHELALGLGMHNDAFAEDATDGGTFVPGPVDGGPSYTEAQLRQTAATVGRLFSMQASPGLAYPTLQNCDRDTDANFFAYSKTYSLSGYDLASGSSPLLQQGGCLTAVIARTGPHFTLRAAALAPASQPGAGISLSLQIHNTGWARLSQPRALYLSLTAPGGIPTQHRLDVDLSAIEPGATLNTTVLVPVTLAAGRYTAALAAPDPAPRLADRADYALLFESIDVPNAQAGANTIGRFEVAPITN